MAPISVLLLLSLSAAFILISATSVKPIPNGDGNCTYTSCGSSCITHCNTHRPRGVACLAVCVPRCACNPGYVYNSKEQCVLPEDCN